MAVSFRPTLLGVVAGATVLAAVAAVPATAQTTTAPPGRAVVAGSVPNWAQPAARSAALDPHLRRQVQVALAPRDLAGATALATAVATPGNPRFRHPISAADWNAQFAPTTGTVAAVQQWLRGQGLRVTGVSGNRELVDAVGTVGQLQATFGVRLSGYRATIHGQRATLVAPDSAVTVPTSLAGQVTAVLGLDDSDRTVTPAQSRVPVPAAAPAAAGTGCASSWGASNNTTVPQRYPAPAQSNELCGYTSAALRAMYGLAPAATGAGAVVAIVGAYNDNQIVADTNHAAHDFGAPQLTAGQYTPVLPAGGFTNNPNCDVESWHAEQALDVQSVHTEAPAAQIRYYAASDCSGLTTAFTQAVSDDQASIITNSWGGAEAGVPAATRSAFESAAVQAAAQGQTVLFSSGDSGDDSITLGSAAVNYPASDPWVTAVGGVTVGLDTGNRPLVLTGWADTGNVQSGSNWTALPPTSGGFAGGSGGGTSTPYPTPTYQSGLPSAATHGHRALPDIAGSADPYTGMLIGYTSSANGFVEVPFGGTSEASPQVAGLVADAAQVVGNGGWLGLINPALYQFGPTAITDVVAQHAGVWTPFQPGASTPTSGSFLVDVGATPQSLTTGPGWDNETGVGVPNSGFVAALAAAAA
jgi:subtilase family serine protease